MWSATAYVGRSVLPGTRLTKRPRALLVLTSQEEEAIGLPLLRMTFTHKELVPVEKKLIAQLTPVDMVGFVLACQGLVAHTPNPFGPARERDLEGARTSAAIAAARHVKAATAAGANWHTQHAYL